MNGRNVALLTICAARVSSTKPMIEASDVPFSTCTMKPTVGGMAMRSACGRMTRRSWSSGLSAIARAPSHWPRGMAWMQPRQISARKALV